MMVSTCFPTENAKLWIGLQTYFGIRAYLPMFLLVCISTVHRKQWASSREWKSSWVPGISANMILKMYVRFLSPFQGFRVNLYAGQIAELSQLLGQCLQLQIFWRNVFYYPKQLVQKGHKKVANCHRWDHLSFSAVLSRDTLWVILHL